MTMTLSTHKHVNPFNELQIVTWVLAHPDHAGDFPLLDKMLTEPVCISAFKAIKDARTGNIGVIAGRMSSNGVPGMTVEKLERELDVIRSRIAVDDINPWLIYDELHRLWQIRVGVPAIKDGLAKVEAGKLSPLDFMNEMQEELMALQPYSKVDIVSTDNWAERFIEEQQHQKALFESGKLLELAPMLMPVMSRHVDLLLPGLYVLLGDTGTQKTDIVDIIAHDAAERSGAAFSVFYSENTWREFSYRQVQRRTTLQLNELKRGYSDRRAVEALKPYKSGGRVSYVHATGMTIKTAVAIARRNKSHIVMDVFHDISMGDIRKPGMLISDVYMQALAVVSEYCKTYDRIALLTVQINAEKRRAAKQYDDKINAADALGGSAYESKAAGMFVTNSPWLLTTYPRKDDPPMLHPWTRKPVVFEKGIKSPLMTLKAEKATNFRSGKEVVLWGDAERRWIREVPEAEQDIYKEHLREIYRRNLEVMAAKRKQNGMR